MSMMTNDQDEYLKPSAKDDDQGRREDAPPESEPLGRADLRMGSGRFGMLASAPLMSALALGLLLAWIYLAWFSPKLFPAGGVTEGMAAAGEMSSFAGYLAWVLLCVVRYRRLVAQWNGRLLLCAGVSSVGTALVAAAAFAGDVGALPMLVCIASAAAGLGSGCILVSWALQFARGDEHASLQVGGGLLVSFAVTCAALLLPFEAAAPLIALLPFASGVAIVCATRARGTAAQAAPRTPVDPAATRLPWRLALGLTAMGLVYGLAYGFAFDYAEMGIEMSVGCLLVNGLVGAVVLAYAVKAGKNFGYSAANLAILPLAGFAQCMIVALQTELLPVSFFIVRLAYVLFDVMLWLQLPKVYARIGTVRTFLVSRLLLEGSAAVGIAMRQLLVSTGFEVFEAVSLSVLAYVLVALTLAFRGESVGNVWDLMPEPVVRTGRFRRACRQISTGHGLTQREAEIMRLVMRGRSGSFVQEKLFISKSTFQTHMRNLYHKLDVHSNQELLDLLECTMGNDEPDDRP